MAKPPQDIAATPAPLRPVRLGVFDAVLQRKPHGIVHMRTKQVLPPYHAKLSEPLEHWAVAAPDRIFIAQHDTDRSWRTLSYAQTLTQVKRIGAALLRRGLSADKPIAIISGNDIEHAVLALAAMVVGIPYAPISPAYSLMSSDFGKLHTIIELLTPGMVFANDGGLFARALYATVRDDTELVVTRNSPGDRRVTMFSDLLGTEDVAGVAAAQSKVTPDTVAKFLFTSGSTGAPKAVINTHRMLCSNQAMIAAGFCFVADEPPVVVDWLPWSHTFGSNHNFNLVLMNGGSLYIDDGNPTPPGVPKTVRNLREIAPTIYFNVPRGYEALVPHFYADETLRKNFFSRLKVLFYAGAGLNQNTWDELTKLTIEATGERIIFLSSLGSTETSPLALSCCWDFDRPGNIGLPAPGVELKLVPNEGKLEARLRGPHITPGYWRQDALTREAFAEEATRLLQLPDNPFPLIERVAVKVGKTPYVRFDLNDYTVPHTSVQRVLTVLADPHEVRIVDGAELLASHPRSYDKGAQIEVAAHIAALVADKRAARHHRGTDRLAMAAPASHRSARTMKSCGAAGPSLDGSRRAAQQT